AGMRRFIMLARLHRGDLLRRWLAGCIALLIVAVVAPESLAQFATPVALRGQVAPDSGGNAFSGFNRPAINNFGQVAFDGLMPGLGQGGDQVAGVFLTQRPFAPTMPQLTGSLLTGTLTEAALFAGPAPGNSQVVILDDGTVDPAPPNNTFAHD